MNETIESQSEELHRAQGDERRRQDQQLIHDQLLEENWDLREAHEKSLNEMNELKKFQSSTFDTIARRRLVEDQDTILELIGKIQELQNEINCMAKGLGPQGMSITNGGGLARVRNLRVCKHFFHSGSGTHPAVVPSSRRGKNLQWDAKEEEPGCPIKGKWPPRGTRTTVLTYRGSAPR